jgi:hypothetical protein
MVIKLEHNDATLLADYHKKNLGMEIWFKHYVY